MDSAPRDIEDDGYETLDMSAVLARASANASPAVATDAGSTFPPPMSRTERFMASLMAEKDEADATLLGIEAQVISVQETTTAAERQHRAEYQQAIASAKAKMQTNLDRLSDDRDVAMAELEAAKDDWLGVLGMLSAAIERGAKAGGQL